jgi:hypothetical protein
VPLLHAVAALVLLLAVAPTPARAATVYETYSLPDGPTDAIIGQFNNRDLQLAYPFEVPAGIRAPLDFVKLRLRHADPTHGIGDVTVRLRADDGGEPGAVLESWTHTQQLPFETDVQFDSLLQPPLLEGATYWLNVKVEPGTGECYWMATNETTPDMLFAFTGGLNPVWQEPANPYLLTFAQVEVPEPAHALLVLAGAAVLAPLRRRCARR